MHSLPVALIIVLWTPELRLCEAPDLNNCTSVPDPTLRTLRVGVHTHRDKVSRAGSFVVDRRGSLPDVRIELDAHLSCNRLHHGNMVDAMMRRKGNLAGNG